MLTCLLGWGLFAPVVFLPTTPDGRTYVNDPGMVFVILGLVWIRGLTVLARIPLLKEDPLVPPPL